MTKEIIRRLKKNKRFKEYARQIKKNVKHLSGVNRFFLKFLKRKPAFFFYSSSVSFKKVLGTPLYQDPVIELEKLDDKIFQALSIHEDVISHPLGDGKVKNFSGGLIDSKTFTLIHEGIHFNTDFCQELPPFFTPASLNKNLPETKHIVLFGGILYNNFGHFLLESLGRLWAYDYVKEHDPYILFYTYWGEPKYTEYKNFVHQVLAGFNIPHKRLLFINEVAKIQKIIIPAQKYGYIYCRNPDSVFLNFVNRFRFPSRIPVGFESSLKIYVSRTKMPTRTGKQIGEKHFERYLISEGYKPFYPERFTLYEQLTVYARAEKIIFSDGGALHACILLPALQAQVAIVSRRKDPVWIPEEIADQFRGYGKEITWIDAVSAQYQFGMDTWHAISVIDWFKVGSLLKSNGFVQNEYKGLSEDENSALIRTEVLDYADSIKKDPRFEDFLMKLREYP